MSINEEQSVIKLSRIRTFLFWALAIDWLIEMVFLGFQSFSKVWTSLWLVIPPENPQLASALYINWAIAAPLKGAFFVMAVFGARSKSPFTRTALFASMALVPPLNLLFPFREQGFLFEPVAVATVLTIILWGGFFLFWEPIRQSEQKEVGGSEQLCLSRWGIFQNAWFVIYSAALTLFAFLLMVWPGNALNYVFPCLSRLLIITNGGLSSLIYTNMAAGTHVLALAIASWIATIYYRSNPTLRQALTVACTVSAGLFIVFPLWQLILEFGGACAISSILIVFVPLFIGWVLYEVFSYMEKTKIVS